MRPTANCPSDFGRHRSSLISIIASISAADILFRGQKREQSVSVDSSLHGCFMHFAFLLMIQMKMDLQVARALSQSISARSRSRAIRSVRVALHGRAREEGETIGAFHYYLFSLSAANTIITVASCGLRQLNE